MNEEYLLQLYKYISDNDTSYKNDVSFDSFRSDMSDSQYASQIYGYLNDLDSTFSDDVSVIDFIKDINTDPNQVKKKDTVVDVTSPMEPMGSTFPQEDTSGLSESEELLETEADVANPFEGMSLFKETSDLENKKFVEDIEAQSNKVAESYADELDNEFYAQEEVVNLINEANRRSKNEVQAFVDNLVSSGIDPKAENIKKQIQEYYSLIFDRELSSDEKFNSLVSSYSDVRADKVFSRVKEYQSSAAKAKKAKDLMDNPIYETLSKIPVAKKLLDNYLLSDGLVGEASSAFMYGKPASKELVPVAEASIELKKDRARLARMDANGVDELVEYKMAFHSGVPPTKIKFTRDQVLDRIQSSSDELASLSTDKISRALDLQKISQFLSPEDQFLEGDFTLESLGGLVGQQLANQVEIPILGTYALELGASYLDTVKEIAEYKYGEASPENIIKVIDSGEDGAADLAAAAHLSAIIDAFGLIPLGKGVSVATKGAIKAGSKTASTASKETFKKTIIGRVKKQIKDKIKDKIKNKAVRNFIDDSYQVAKGALIAGGSEFPTETTQSGLVSEASRRTIEDATGQELEIDIEGALKEGAAGLVVGTLIPATAGSVSISGRGARDVYKSSTKSLAEKARRKIQEKSKDYLVNESPKTRVEINEIIESAKTPEDLNGIFINNDKGLEDKLTSKYNQLKDAVQEQETGDVPITEQAEGVQEVETEVREPSIQEKRQKIEQRRQEELEPVMSAMAASEQTGEVPVVNGELVNKETLDDINAKYDVELDALQETRPSDVETEESVPSQTALKVSSDAKSALDNNKPKQELSVDENGNTVVNEVEFFNEDANLELDRLSLLAEKGRLTVDEFQRSYFGQSTDVVTFPEVKKEIQSNPVDFINSLKNSFNELNASQPAVEESVASPEVIVEDAPDGTFLNIEMVAGKEGAEIAQKDILDALPIEPLNVEMSGKTLVIQVPRELSNSEMMKLAKDTNQDAIPQVSNKKGVLHAQSQEKMDLYEGKFVPNLFIQPKKIIKDERPKAGNRLFNEPIKAVKAIADRYYERAFKGKRQEFKGVKKIDKDFAKRISDAFDAMQENPNDPEVKAAYEAMAKETMDQYQDFNNAGYTIEINNSEPYKNSQEMIDDLRKNKRMKIFSTESGFGDTPITDKQREENPLLRDSGVKDVNGNPLLINDVFRAVHDFYGHAELGNSFGPLGEENAWNVHARMFSPLARRAMTTETRGQNSYVNFSGINDEAFKLRDEARKLREEGKEAEADALTEQVYEMMKFADQKVGLLPEDFSSLQESDIDQTLSEESLTGYDKMMNRIDDIIQRMSKKPDMTNEKILDSVTKNLQSRDPAYKRATDVQREQIIRDLRSRLGFKEKAAPSAKRVTGQPARKKVTVDEYASLKSQIRLEAKAAREAVTSYKNAGKKIAEAVKALGGKGKITLRQANTVAKKILRTNFTNTKQVDALLDYVQKIYERAELAEMVSNAKGRIKQAKKNLASKVGTNTALKSAVQDLLSLDPTDVPLNLLPQYVALVQSFGERKAVLNLPEQGVVMQTANAILDSVQKSFDVTTTERVEDADYDLDQAVKEIREDKIDTENILNPDVKKLAQKLNSLTKKDVEGLVTENKDGVKNYAKVENLKAVKREMSKGYAPKLANDLAVEIESQRSYDSLENEGAIDRVQKRGIMAIGRTIASIKSIITGRGITQEQLRSIPFIGTSLDNVLGNLNQIQFREKIIDPVANAFSMMTDKMQDVRNEYLQTAEYLLSNDGFVKRSRNAILKSKYKVQLYLLEKENLSNLGSNQVAPAIEFLNETIKYLSKDTSARRNMNKEILEELREEFAPNDGPLDFEKLENSLSKNEIQAATLINQAYNETSSMYEFVSSVVRGEGLKPLNNYVHHSVLKDLNEQKKDNDLTVERITKPSTKSKTIIERTPGAKAINFDPISSADRGVKMMLTDYYMTNPIREVRSLINKLKDTPDLTQFQKDAFEDLDKVFEESIEIVFGKSLESITGVNNFFNAVEELGYYAALASVPRAAAELGSNFAGAVIMNPRTFSLGVTNFSKISFDSTSVAKFAAAIGSKSRSKLAPKGIGGKIQQELTNYNVTSRNKGALNPILDKANFIAKNTTGRIGTATADIAQKLLSTPDMAISRPMYFQTFVNEFQKITGEKLTNDDLQAIADGDTKILEKYPDAVSKARDVADTAIERLSGTTNPLKQPLKYQLKVGDDAFTKVYKKANKYMASFYSVENNTATEGTIALFYSGEITRRQATSLLAMITTRMTVYMAMYAFLQNVFDQLISNALGFRQEDEEDEDYTLLTSRQLVGSISTLILRRSLGSVSSIPVMYGIEKVNEEYLGALRGGNEYDKFKNGIVYVPIRENKSPIEQGVSMLSGAKGPALNTISRLATVISGITGSDKKETRDQYTDELLNRMSIEVLGNVGLLPFYKDIRRMVIEDTFSEREYQKVMKKLQKEIEKEEQKYYREQKKKSKGFGSKRFGSKGFQ